MTPAGVEAGRLLSRFSSSSKGACVREDLAPWFCVPSLEAEVARAGQS